MSTANGATKAVADMSKMTIAEIEAHLKSLKAASALAKAEESNVSMEITNGGKLLVIKVDLTKDLGESKSQKSRLVGSTHGNIPVVDGLFASINVFKPVKK